jgi:hypothetical protein
MFVIDCQNRISVRDGRNACSLILNFVDRRNDCPCCFHAVSSAASRPQARSAEDVSAAVLPPATNRGGKVLPEGNQIAGDFCEF